MRTALKLMILVLVITYSAGCFAQTRTFKEGNVWQVSLIKSETGQGEAYLNNLKVTWKAVMDEAVKQNLLVSYKILSGESANPGDWDIMLMQEYKNLASMEGKDDQWDAIFTKVIGSDDSQNKLMATRVNMRTIYGGKLLREVVYK
jgi:hypothetical protein